MGEGYDAAMPPPEEQTAVPAGVLPPEQVDVVALFEQLQEEIRRGGAGGGDGVQTARVTWRAQAERVWPVSAERPIVRRPGWLGAVSIPVKQLLRPFLRWYVEPLAAEQRAFNDAVLKLVDDLDERISRLEQRK